MYLLSHTTSWSGQGTLYLLPLQPHRIPAGTEEDHGNLSKNGRAFSLNPRRSPVECRCTIQQVATWNPLQGKLVTVKGLKKPSLSEHSTYGVSQDPRWGVTSVSKSFRHLNLPHLMTHSTVSLPLHFLHLSWKMAGELAVTERMCRQ